VKQKKERT